MSLHFTLSTVDRHQIRFHFECDESRVFHTSDGTKKNRTEFVWWRKEVEKGVFVAHEHIYQKNKQIEMWIVLQFIQLMTLILPLFSPQIVRRSSHSISDSWPRYPQWRRTKHWMPWATVIYIHVYCFEGMRHQRNNIVTVTVDTWKTRTW